MEQKSEEIDENKRHKAVFQENSQKYNRDPILEGEDLKQKPLRICPKNVQISEEYEKYKEKIMLLPSERTSHHPNTFENRSKDSIKPILESRNETIKANNLSQKENKTEIKATGKECKSLLCYEYALPYKKEAFSKEIGKFSIAERSFVYKDVNERDFRKKAMIFQYKD